jgi:hypothetical protein
LISLVAAAAVIVPLIVSARAQTPPTPSFASKVVLDNDRVRVQRLTVPVGFREGLQVVPNDQMAIQMTPGELEVVINGQKTAGKVETAPCSTCRRMRHTSSRTSAARRTTRWW